MIQLKNVIKAYPAKEDEKNGGQIRALDNVSLSVGPGEWVAITVLMWIPGLVSILFRLLFREGFGDVGWSSLLGSLGGLRAHGHNLRRHQQHQCRGRGCGQRCISAKRAVATH